MGTKATKPKRDGSSGSGCGRLDVETGGRLLQRAQSYESESPMIEAVNLAYQPEASPLRLRPGAQCNAGPQHGPHRATDGVPVDAAISDGASAGPSGREEVGGGCRGDQELTEDQIIFRDIIGELTEKVPADSTRRLLRKIFKITFRLTPSSSINYMIDGESLLYHVARELGPESVTKCIDDFGADPWTQNCLDSKVPLHAALQRGHVAISKILLDKMARAEQKWTARGRSLKEMSFTLLQKVICNSVPVEKRPADVSHVDCLEILLNEISSIDVHGTMDKSQMMKLSCTKCDIRTILDVAVDLDDGEEKRLLEGKAQLRIRPHYKGQHSIDWVTVTSVMQSDNRDSLEILLCTFDHRGHNFPHPRNAPNKMTLFHAAVAFRARRCLQLLLKKNRAKDHLNEPDEFGRTPLHYVATIKHNKVASEILSMLLKAGAYVNSRDRDGNTLLHKLAESWETQEENKDQINMVDIILNQEEVNIEARNVFDLTVFQIFKLQFDYYEGSVVDDVLNIMLEKIRHREDIVKSSDGLNQTRSHDNLLEDLITEDTNLILEKVDMATKFASSTGLRQFVGTKTILYHVVLKLPHDIVKTFLTLGHDPWVTNSDDKKLPLHAALERGNPKLVGLLLHAMKQRRNLEKVDLRDISFSLLQCLLCNFKSCEEGEPTVNSSDCLQILLNGDVIISVDQPNSDGTTAIDIATWINLEGVRRNLAQVLGTHHLVSYKKESQMLDWSKLVSILRRDDAVAFAVELAKRGNKLQDVVQPADAPRNQTMFHAAVEKASINCLKVALARLTSMSDLDRPDVNGKTPLHYAVPLALCDKSSISFQIVMLLLKHGAYINSRDKLGNSPVHDLAEGCADLNWKLSNQFLAFSKLILHHQDVDPNAKNSSSYNVLQKLPKLDTPHEITQRNKFMNKIVEDFESLFVAQTTHATEDNLRARLTEHVVNANYDNLEKMINTEMNEAHSAEKTSFQKWENWYIGTKPLLHYIVKNLSLICVQKCLEHGLDPWLLCTKDGRLALHEALVRGHVGILETLLNFMKNTKKSNVYDIRRFSFSLLKTVLCNARTHSTDFTPPPDHNRCLKLILDNKTLSLDFNQTKSALDPTTPLDLAIRTRNKLAERMLKVRGGVCSTFSAVIESNTITWERASEILRTDNRDDLELELALRSNRPLEFIRPTGAPHGQTILHCAVDHFASDCLELLVNKIECTSLLLDEPDKYGNTALHSVAQRANKANKGPLLKCLDLLVKNGSSVNTRDRNMDTPLHVLSRKSAASGLEGLELEAYVDVLLSSKLIDLDAVNYHYETPSKIISKKLCYKFDDYTRKTKERSEILPNKDIMLMGNLFKALKMLDEKLLETTLNGVFKNSHIQLKNQYFGTKTLLYYFTELLELDYVQHALQIWNFNPWLPNTDDGMLPLHAALARGNLPNAHLLLQQMKKTDLSGVASVNPRVNLKRFSASLLRKTLCNYSPWRETSRQSDQIGCLKRLLEPDVVLDVNATDVISGFSTPLDIAHYIDWKEAINCLLKVKAVNSRMEVIKDSAVDSHKIVNVLQEDKRDALEMVLCGHIHSPSDLQSIVRPTHNSSMQTIFHLAINKKNCFRFLVDCKTLTSHIDDPDQSGMTPLHCAVESACKSNSMIALLSVQRLLKQGANINARNKNGDTPLHLLASNALLLEEADSDGCSQCLEVLLSHQDNDINAINGFMQTSLSKLVNGINNEKCFAIQVCQTLIKHGATIREFEKYRITNFNFFIPESDEQPIIQEVWHWQLFNSVVIEDTQCLSLDQMTETGKFCNQYIGTKTILYNMVQLLEAEKIEILLKSGADPWLMNIDDGKLPLHVCLARGHIKTVRLLLKHMKITEQSPQVDLRHSSFSLFQSVLCNFSHSSEEILESPEVDYVGCLEALLEKNILLDFEQQSSMGGCNIRQLAGLIHNEPMKHILEEKGLRLDDINDGEFAPIEDTYKRNSLFDVHLLQNILQTDNRDMLELEIVKLGNNVDTVLTQMSLKNKGTILHETVNFAAPNCLQYLLAQNAAKFLTNQPDDLGRTPLHIAVLKTASSCNAFSLHCLKLLLSKRASINCRDNDGNSPLHLLASLACDEPDKDFSGIQVCLEIFVKNNGLNVNPMNLNHQTPTDIFAVTSCNESVNVEEFKMILSLYRHEKPTCKYAGMETILDKITESMLLYDELVSVEQLQELMNELESLGHFESYYCGNKSLLFYLAQRCSLQIIDTFIWCGGDPWAANVRDGKLPIHAAMSRCDPDIVILLLQHMKRSLQVTGRINLAPMSFSLLQTFLCSCKRDKPDEMKCLIRILEDASIDINQSLSEDTCVDPILPSISETVKAFGTRLTPKSIAKWTNNNMAVSILERKGGVDVELPRDQVLKPFTWPSLDEILKGDHIQALEIEVARFGGNLDSILRPSDAPLKQSMFHGAVEHAAINCLRYLVKKMTSPLQLDEPDTMGRTPLHYAVEYGFIENNPFRLQALAILLKAGANVNARDNVGDTALHSIMQMSLMRHSDDASYYLNYVDLLLSCQEIDLQAKNRNNQMPMHFKSYFEDDANERNAIYTKVRDKLKDQIGTNENSITAQLFNALLVGDQTSLKKLMERIRDFTNKSPKYLGAKTVLYHLTEKMNANALRKILINGFDPWVANIDDDKYPLHAALAKGDSAMVELLLDTMKQQSVSKSADLRHVSFSLLKTIVCNSQCPGRTATDSKEDYFNCLQQLMCKDVKLDINRNCERDKRQSVTSVTLAGASGLQHLKNILQQHTINIFQKYDMCTAPLQWDDLKDILIRDDRDALEIEMAIRGDRLENIYNPAEMTSGKNVFHAAVEFQALNCLLFLLNKCPSRSLLNQPDVDGKSPLHYAVVLRSDEKRILPCMKHFLNTPSSSSETQSEYNSLSKKEHQFTPVQEFNTTHIVKELIFRGAYVNTRDNFGDSPLHNLVKQCRHQTVYVTDILIQTIDVLLDSPETDIDAINSIGETPLYHLRKYITESQDSTSEICKKMISSGASAPASLTFQLCHKREDPRTKRRWKQEGFTELLHFIIAKDERAIKRLFRKFLSQNVRNWENKYIGSMPLFFYIIANFDHEIVNCFLCFGGDSWKQDLHGNLPLIAAAGKGDFRMVDLLITSMKGRDDNCLLNLEYWKRSLVTNVLQNFAKSVMKPTGINYHKCLKRLFRGDVLLGKLPEDVIDLAKDIGDTEIMKILSNQDDSEWTWDQAKHVLDKDDTEALERKLQRMNGCVELLLRPLNVPNSWTLLHTALDYAISGRSDCFAILLENLMKHKEYTARKVSSMNDTGLVRHYQNPINEPDTKGETVLHKAAMYQAPRTIEKLLALGGDINASDDTGNTPLTILTQKRSGELSDTWDKNLKVLLSPAQTDVRADNALEVTLPVGQHLEAKTIRDNQESGNTIKFQIENLHESQQLYNSVQIKNIATIKNILETLDSTSRTVLIQNQNIGSKTILYLITSFLDERMVRAFMTMGCDPWRRNVNGEIPLHLALQKGHVGTLEVLIEGMKKWKSTTYVDLTEFSYTFLTLPLVASKEADKIHLIDHNKCLKRLLKKDILLDINAIDKDASGYTALQVAAIVGNQTAMRMLITKGAFIGVKRNVKEQKTGGILGALIPSTLENAINKCVNVSDTREQHYTSTDVVHPLFALQLDYSFLLSPDKIEFPSRGNNKKSNISFQVAETVLEISEDTNHQNCLQSPLMEVLLDAKWRSIHHLIIGNATITALFLVSIVFQCILLNLSINEIAAHRSETVMFALSALLMLLTILIGLRESLEVITSFKSYFGRMGNYVTWFLIASAVIVSFVPLQQVQAVHLSAWTTIVAFYELLLTFEHVIEGHYIGKFRYTVRNISRYFGWFSLPMMAAGISMWFLYAPPPNEEFSYSLHIARVYAMAAADFTEFFKNEDLAHDSFVSLSLLIYFLVFFVMIILSQMILITAMTISDVREFTESVQVHTKRSKWKVVHRYEQMLDTAMWLRSLLPDSSLTVYIDRLVRRFQLPNSTKSTILLRLNEINPAKRMVLSDGVYEYYWPVSDKVSTKFRSIYLENLYGDSQESSRVEVKLEALHQQLEKMAGAGAGNGEK